MKTLFLSLFLSVQLMAFDIDTASKIFNKIFTAISSNEEIKVYVLTPEYKKVVEKAFSLKLVDELCLADIALITTLRELNSVKKKIIFTTNLEVLRKENNVIGAFYWEYGRPQILFIQQRLEAHNIKLSEPFKRYIVKKVP